MTLRGKLLVLLAALAVLGAVAAASLLHAADRAAEKDRPQAGGPAIGSGRISLAAGADRRIVFRNMAWGPHRDELVTVPAGAPSGPRTASGVKCLRFHAAGGTGICLQAVRGAVDDTYRAVVLDAALEERAHYPLPGIPTRARVSPSGRLVAWTVFVGGDSYASASFSTRTAVLDTTTGRLTPSLEGFRVVKDGKEHHAADTNFWGVTFTRDDRHFYATMATGGRTYLVRGDLTDRTVTTLHQNVECPSLSPDETRIVYKKRVAGAPADAPWHEYALDLATLRETALAEPRSVDDQAVWLDDRTVAYSLPGDFGADLYSVPADGSGAPRRLMTAALAPAFLK
ncbi:TolB-like translocation protein [Streptomyces sp. SP18ES09]|uniref:TolB family protein n=1 Tax=Streptomyces sp. SP18ES09 TaxID=3002532 RepID=UPI002E75D567|nr:TolB-like translocation protein [Streptomyces sp. SP18ES09]MEE1820333.1 TolB-like translocation protein [Streptomyces sp. SP18ES09]